MSKRISDELNTAIKEYKSCFNCTFFKTKPFKYNELNNRVDIDFKLVASTGRCTKNKFDTNIAIRSSINSKMNKSVILRDALKSFGRYKTMAENCTKYDGEETQAVPKPKKPNYKLIKYLF